MMIMMIIMIHLVLIVDDLSVSNRLVLRVQPTEGGRWFGLCLIIIIMIIMVIMMIMMVISFWYCTIYQSQDCCFRKNAKL